jgi:hypothetical protein
MHMFTRHIRQRLLLIAALCSLVLPGVMMIKQAQAGELLKMLCTTEGKKAVAGTTAGSHDCQQCCASSPPPISSAVSTYLLGTRCDITPCNGVTHAVLNAAYLTPAATGPPDLQ